MPSAAKIRVMISSRCNDEIQLDGLPARLSDVRRRLKAELESTFLFGNPLFEVWINEDAPPAEGSTDAWDHCMNQVRRADIVLVLYNGNSGWAREGGEIGICHAELQAALSTASAKVRLLALPELPIDTSATPDRDQRFRRYVERQNLFWARTKNGNEAIVRTKDALFDATVEMVRLGVREARKGKFHTGEALEWSRMNAAERQSTMRAVLRQALLERDGAQEHDDQVLIPIDGVEVLVLCHGVPASLTNAAAREMIGQPFLKDHQWADLVEPPRGGPIHIVACHRTATETQASKLLGIADVIAISAPFGVFAVDPINNVQIALISNCHDETTTRHGVQRFFEWLQQSSEAPLTRRRAEARAQICRTVATMMRPTPRT